jgi:hypothetical protein
VFKSVVHWPVSTRGKDYSFSVKMALKLCPKSFAVCEWLVNVNSVKMADSVV